MLGFSSADSSSAAKGESVELTDEEKALNITKVQKERMERDHDMIKDYYKVGIG